MKYRRKTQKNENNYYLHSQAVVVERNVYVSGCLGINLETGKLVDGGVKQQAETALTHLKNILRASGSTMNNVVKTTVFLQDFNDFPIVNEIYKEGKLNRKIRK